MDGLAKLGEVTNTDELLHRPFVACSAAQHSTAACTRHSTVASSSTALGIHQTSRGLGRIMPGQRMQHCVHAVRQALAAGPQGRVHPPCSTGQASCMTRRFTSPFGVMPWNSSAAGTQHNHLQRRVQMLVLAGHNLSCATAQPAALPPFNAKESSWGQGTKAVCPCHSSVMTLLSAQHRSLKTPEACAYRLPSWASTQGACERTHCSQHSHHQEQG